MKFYISCADANHGRLKAVLDTLTSVGHTPVYEWWDKKTVKGKEDFEIAFNRVQAVENAELYLCLLPATRTCSIEFGTALANRYGKRIILWSEQADELSPKYANPYYLHPSVTRMACPLSELCEYLKKL